MGWFRRDTRLQSRLDLLSSEVAALGVHVAQLQKLVDSSVPAILRADIEDLRAAVDVDRIAHRKQLARLWGRIGHEERSDNLAGVSPGGSGGDDELEGFLQLQQQHRGA